MLAFTVLALGIRLYTLSRSGYLTGVTEYDDGVYLGGAIRLLQGALPYHNWAYVQPPGILLLMTPVALLTKITTTTHALAVARLLTVGASAACVPLVGSLVRHRGTLVTLVTCGILTVYPDDITTAHTLILEPWMNLLLMIGVCFAFRQGRLASPRWLLWSGVVIGVAGAVKYWAALPALVLLVMCLLTEAERRRRTVSYVVGLLVGFLVPVLPFAVLAPAAFVRSTLLDQAARSGSSVPTSMRLAHITGLIDFLNAKAQLTFDAGTHSLFASGGAAATPGTSAGWLPYAVFLVVIAIVAGGYLLQPGRLLPLAWFAIGSAVLATAAVLAYSAFFYHYPDFGAPWIALAVGGAFGALSEGRLASWLARTAGGVRLARRGLIGLLALALVLLAAFQIREISGLAAPDIYPDQAAIPAGSCVVTDQISMAIAANRFTSARSGCPDVMDSLAETLTLGNGVSVQGGAASLPHVVAAWRSIFAKADYVWLSPNNTRRIPWTPGLTSWFDTNFVQVPAYGGLGMVYKNIGA
jgi:hypothetical protein